MATGAIIAGAASLLGNMLGASSQASTNSANYKINQMNNEFNERMMNKQMDYNTMMWEKNNQYNTPAKQMQRYRDAGINPYFAMENLSAGNAQSAGSTSAASAAPAAPQQAFHPNFQGIADGILMGEQAKLTKYQAEQQVIDNQTRLQKNMQEIANTIADTKNKEIQRKLATVQYNYADQVQQLQLQEMQLNNHNIYETGKNIVREGMLMDKSLAIFDEVSRLDIANKAADIVLKDAQQKRTKQETITEIQKMIQITAQTKGIKISNDVARRTADSLVETARNEAFLSGVPKNPWELAGAGIKDGIYGIKSLFK